MQNIYINDFDLKLDGNLENINWNSANGFCFDDQGNVCVVWEAEKGYWCLPGGGKEMGETPEQTFVREVLEEAQAEVDMETLKYFHCIYEKKEKIICFRFICRLTNIQEFIPRKNANNFISEIDERKFVSLEELPEFITWLKDSENGRQSFEILKQKIK